MKHIKNLIFDLDNTLYPLDSGVEPQFMKRILNFYNDIIGINIDEDTVHELKKKYISEMNSAAKLGANVKHFMDYVCDVDVSGVRYDDKLESLLKRLPHKKFIYTNSTHKHVRDVIVDKLRISDLIHASYAPEDVNYELAKPSVEFYESFLSTYGIVAKESAMFEDSHKNLKTAKDLGMFTILISEEKVDYPYVDCVFENINKALEIFEEK